MYYKTELTLFYCIRPGGKHGPKLADADHVIKDSNHPDNNINLFKSAASIVKSSVDLTVNLYSLSPL